MPDQFWDEIRRVLTEAAQAKTADELIAVVATGMILFTLLILTAELSLRARRARQEMEP